MLGGTLLALAAVAFGAPPLLVPGVAAALLGALTPVWVWLSARSARVHRVLSAERVVEEEPVEAILEVRRGAAGLPGGTVIDPLAAAEIPLARSLSMLTGRSHAQVRVLARFPRRGVQRLAPPALEVCDPFGLSRVRRVQTGPPQELLVLPRTEAVRWATGPGGAPLEGEHRSASDEPLSAVEVDGLRPYRDAAPASRIHWSALARGQGLLERRLRADGDPRPLIVLDPRGDGPPEHLDQAVRAAASLVLALARAGGCRVLLPGDRRPLGVGSDRAEWPAVHARLAMVQGGPAARAPAPPATSSSDAVFVVAPAPPPRLQLLAAPGAPATVLVLPAAVNPPAGGAVVLAVSGCRGYGFGLRGRREGAAAGRRRPVRSLA